MRNLFSSKYMYLTAAMLTGAAMFTSCSNEDDMGNVNPTYDGESVKTQFAINIPAAKQADTKMTGENTQQSGTTFLGMTGIRLIPYTQTSWTTTQAINKILVLGDITGAVATNETQRIYNDVDIPVGTDHFLFYGVAQGADNKANGKLNATIDGLGDRSEINFKLEKISTTTAMTEEVSLLKLLNRVENVTGWSAWATETTVNEKTLKNLYQKLILMKAGSATSILNLMQALYRSLKFANASGSADEKLAADIREAILGTGGEFALTATGNLGEETLAYPSTFANNYPANYNLPDGAVRVKFDNTLTAGEKFISDNDSYEIGTTNKLKIKDLTYPSSLYYFQESALKASANAEATFPVNGSWGSEKDWTGWEQVTVDATTRAIAMVSPVNYGVAMLETTVNCKTSSLIDAKGNTIAIGTNGFTLSGVLVGGQPDEIKWNMYQAYSTTLARNQVIYDAAIPTNNKVTTTACDPNYTLILDNSIFTDAQQTTRVEKDKQEKVNIAIELINNTGKEIEGVDGTIFNGSKFYLVAQLNPDLGTNSEKSSVFMKDHKSVAKLTITSLKNAYNGIPDLRSTNLSFGLAVDLKWESGLVFDVEIGGN